MRQGSFLPNSGLLGANKPGRARLDKDIKSYHLAPTEKTRQLMLGKTGLELIGVTDSSLAS